MRGVAEFELIGRLGKIKQVGKTVKVSVASPYSRKKDGEWIEDVFWNEVTALDDAIKTRCQEMGDGDVVRVTGRMRDNSYEKGGETVYTTDRIIDDIHRLHKKGS